jgi:hypothetical protein
MKKEIPATPPFSKGGVARLPLKKISPLLLLVLLLAFRAGAGQAAQITDYRAIRASSTDAAGRPLVAIRSFVSDGVAHLLVVDPVTLKSFDLPASSLTLSAASADAALGATPFLRALDRYSSAPYRLQNGGATRAETAVDGVFLTVDLCPSKRRFERELFEAAGALGTGAPVPVAVAVTGVWLASHPEELSFLKGETAAGRLAITWVNHSYHHPYEPRVPLEQNFLLTPGTDFTYEVLELERQLLARGLVPSPFFRFPGLVSDRATVRRLRELSLIPIGSDAWLAKGESPRQGSFILVHGNGNEPKGVKLLLPMLRGKEQHLLPLPAAFAK